MISYQFDCIEPAAIEIMNSEVNINDKSQQYSIKSRLEFL